MVWCSYSTTNYLHTIHLAFTSPLSIIDHVLVETNNVKLTNELRRVDRDRGEMEGSSCQNGICIPWAESPPRCRRRVAKETLLADRFPSLKKKEMRVLEISVTFDIEGPVTMLRDVTDCVICSDRSRPAEWHNIWWHLPPGTSYYYSRPGLFVRE